MLQKFIIIRAITLNMSFIVLMPVKPSCSFLNKGQKLLHLTQEF